MKSFIAKCFLLLSFACVFASNAQADALPAPSFWKNQRGSELQVWTANGGTFQGQFINNAQGFECQGIPYPAVGRETVTGLFFVVTFAKCNSLTRWYGYVRGSQMFTRWQLFYIKPDGTPGTVNGSDVFQRIN